MGYIEKHLVQGERVIFKTRLHRWVFFSPIFNYIFRAAYAFAIFAAIIGLLTVLYGSTGVNVLDIRLETTRWERVAVLAILYSIVNVLGAPGFPGILAVGAALAGALVIDRAAAINFVNDALIAIFTVPWQWLAAAGLALTLLPVLGRFVEYLSSEFGVTNRRVLIKTGIINRQVTDVRLNQVESCELRETLLGRLIGFRHVRLTATGGMKKEYRSIASAYDLRRSILEGASLGAMMQERQLDLQQQQQDVFAKMAASQQMQARMQYENLDSRQRQAILQAARRSEEESAPLPKTAPLLPETTTDQLKQAARLVEMGDTLGAREIVSAVLKADRENPNAWYMAGYLATSPERKRQAYERALALNPQHVRARAALNKLERRARS